MVFASLVVTAFNVLAFIRQKGTPLYNCSLGLLPIGSFLLSLAVSGLALTFLQTLEGRNVGKEKEN